MAKNDYKNWSKEELIKEVERLRKRKKYGLVWENKPEKVMEQCKRELPVLNEVKGKEIKTDPEKPVNLLIEGDNYHALSVLNYTHKGKIDVIYIDPPYNTGNKKDFMYNDRYVDKEDSYRHSKWLSFMSKRLLLAKSLLKSDGVMFISIDDNEYAHLKLICDDLFGEDNLETIVWHKVSDDSGRLKITYRVRREHEYILACYKNKGRVRFSKYLSERKYKNKYSNPDSDPRGAYKQGIISSTEEKSKETGKNYYSVTTPSGKVYTRQWRFPKKEFESLDKDNRIYYGKKGNSVPSLKVFLNEKKLTTPTSIFAELGTAKTAGIEVKEIFGNNPFKYPKPVTLMLHIIKIASEKSDLILDFMAGSGTTGHSVLQMNEEDQGNRKFILCTNNEGGIASKVCYPRIEKVINGHTTPKGTVISGLGGNLKYFRTAFVSGEPTDQNKRKLTEKAVEMLCVREDTFASVKIEDKYMIFRGKKRYTGIIFDRFAIGDFKKNISKINSPISVYVFSLGNETFDEEFADLKNNVKLSPIPEAIMQVYRKIFK